MAKERDDDDAFEDDEVRPSKKKPSSSGADDEYDDDEDRPRKKKRSSGGGIGTVIPYKNGMALASYYCGVFGLISCFLGLGFFGIVPIILGILGLMKAKSNPEAHGTGHAWVGIVLGAIEILAGCGVIGFFIFGAALGLK